MRRAFAAALVAGCGLLPTEHDLAPGPSDGTAPFDEPIAIELCAGTSRLSLDASALAAACVPDGATPKACAADADCARIERCLCGRCAVRPCTTSATCEAGEQCRAGRCTAACGADEDCEAGERCVGGGCARACTSDAACAYGERCDDLDDACATRSCAFQSCGGGETCETFVRGLDAHEPFVWDEGGEERVLVEVRDAAGARVVFGAGDGAARWALDLEAPLASPYAKTGGASLLDAPSGERWLFAWGEGPTQAGLPIRALLRFRAPAGTLAFGAPDVLLEPDAPWEGGVFGPTTAMLFGGEVFLAYEAGGGAGLGLALVDEDGAARALGGQPFATPASLEDARFWRGLDRVESPTALITPDGEGERARVWFSARGVEGAAAWVDGALVPAEANDSIGLLASRDLDAFSRYPAGPVLARRTNLRAYLGEREPTVRAKGPRTELVFLGTSPAGAPIGFFRAAGR